jgi:putative ABC transport system permease protein
MSSPPSRAFPGRDQPTVPPGGPAARLQRAKLSVSDVGRVGSAGLRGRPLRVALSALGIAMGIATMITVVGISSSAKAQLLRQLDALGTGMLTIQPGQSFAGGTAALPPTAMGMIKRINGVQQVGATGTLNASVLRNQWIPSQETGGIAVEAATQPLLATLRGHITEGTWLNAANDRYPTVVLGAAAAEQLGITAPGQQVWMGNRYFTVIGILAPLPLAPEINQSALLGWDAAKSLLRFNGSPTKIYEQSADQDVSRISSLLAATADPQAPGQVEVSHPSDALAARAIAQGTFSTLLLGLGVIALLIGGVGVANTMFVSVLERRHEVGLRRSLGATRGQIRLQFLTESLFLSGIGGLTGAVAGTAITAGYAGLHQDPFSLPPWAIGVGLLSTLTIGAAAGIYPAVRAARVSPTTALQTA